MLQKPSQLVQLIEAEIAAAEYGIAPVELYDPISYLMSLGGKRLRPLLTLLSYSLFKEDPKTIVSQAVAVEVFHNFTLMHDDIMDEAPIRRGKPTVHEKWNANTAILSGDVMMVKAYEMMAENNPHLSEVLKKFNRCAIEVCEGQQFDMVFEDRENVKEEEYINMIRLKTAVLLGFSLELGAIMAEADDAAKTALKNFGTNIGIGFQLKDDLLDVYADKAKFGKQVGGDIISNKKTFLLIKAMELAKGADKKELNSWLGKKKFHAEEKVTAITNLYNKLGIREITEEKMNAYFEKGFHDFKHVDADLPRKKALRDFAENLINREK